MEINLHCVNQFGPACVLEAPGLHWDINMTRVVPDTPNRATDIHSYTHMFTHEHTELKRLAKLTIYFVFYASFLQRLFLQFIKTSSPLHRTLTGVRLCSAVWTIISQSSWIHADAPVCSVCFLKTPLFLFLILWGEAERGREKERETSIECWQGHNLPSLHTLFTVSLPAAIPSSLNGAIKNK